MQNKNTNYISKFSYLTSLLLILLFISVYMSGCSSSEEEEVQSQRELDSLEFYSQLQKSFGIYNHALSYNENSDTKNAAESFENALKQLRKIDSKILNEPGNYTWKQDYNELAVSIVQDYISTQSEISSGSLVFDFAEQFDVKYQKIEEVSGDREELPDGSDIPLDRNAAVDGYIEFFTNTDRGKSFIDKTLYRSGKYFPLMRKILKYNKAPEELIYLSVQESGLAPQIMSHAGAVGLWQFMPATGYAYGLGQDEYRDDRMDMEKSTDAAARHLKDLYRTFGDWYLAFAAYNAGPGRVNSAIKRSGSRDFWTLRGFLPGETKNYVPSILALSYVFRDPEGFGFRDVEYGKPISFDRVNVNAPMTLQQVADLCESDIETIRELNSELTQDMVPDYEDYYQLRIPHKTYEKFLANYNKATGIDKSGSKEPVFAGDEAGGYRSRIDLTYYKVNGYEPGDPKSIASKNGRKKVTYNFKKKDALSAIAVFYSVRPVEIRIWNNLNYGEPIKHQQPLDIYLTEEKYNLLHGLNNIKGADIVKTNDGKRKAIDEYTLTNTGEDNAIKNSEEKNEQSGENKTSSDNNSDSFLNSNKPGNETVTEKNNDTEVNSGDNKTTENTNTGSVTREETEYSEESYTETVKAPENKTKTVKEKKKTTAKGNTVIYTVSEGDNLSSIADENGLTVNEIMELNGLESDKILVGQKLKLSGSNSSASKTSVHTVSTGENLTMIADKYGMSLSELKDLNDLDSDVIIKGQKLKVTAGQTEGNTNSGKKSTGKTTHKVKSGETLASIASEYGVSISELKKWNNLKSDKIMSGQVLKLSDGSGKKKKQ